MGVLWWNYKVPEENTLKGLLKNIDIKNIEIDEKIKNKNWNGSLDFGGIVKGYAVDKIREILIENSVKEAVINLGGDILVWGDRKFKIGVNNPRGDGIIYTFELNGNSTVSTSGDYENFFILDNKRYHHIINPEMENLLKVVLLKLVLLANLELLEMVYLQPYLL